MLGFPQFEDLLKISLSGVDEDDSTCSPGRSRSLGPWSRMQLHWFTKGLSFTKIKLKNCLIEQPQLFGLSKKRRHSCLQNWAEINHHADERIPGLGIADLK